MCVRERERERDTRREEVVCDISTRRERSACVRVGVVEIELR